MGPFEKWSGRHSRTTLRVWGIGTKPECPPTSWSPISCSAVRPLDRRPDVGSVVVGTLDMTSFNLLSMVEATL